MSNGLEHSLDVDNPSGVRAVAMLVPPRRDPTEPPVESVDTFAIAEPGQEPMVGGEPPVFGGVNPALAGSAALDGSTDADGLLLGAMTSPLEEQLRAGELLGDAPQINIRAIVSSTPFLVALLIVTLIAATVFIRASIRTETYVHTNIRFVNFEKLDDEGRQELELEINKLLRTYPVRAEAWELLQKRSPGLIPGFLNSGLTFHRLDSLLWDPNGTLRLRVDSEDPANDIARVTAIVDAFYNQAQARNKRRDDFRKELADAQQRQFALLQLDADLKRRIDELLTGAQRYMDLKAALQATERYLELADESNPLRLVARQNLKRLGGQVAEARGVAIERDEKLATRVGVQKEIDDLTGSMAKLRRYIDTFCYPEAPDKKAMSIYDSRPQQKSVMRSAWVGLIAIFGGIIGYLRYQEYQEMAAEREARRERRRVAVMLQGDQGG